MHWPEGTVKYKMVNVASKLTLAGYLPSLVDPTLVPLSECQVTGKV